MGIHDRPYMQSGGDGGRRFGSFTFGMPKPGKAVKYLLIINLAVFVLQIFFDRGGQISRVFGATVGGFWQVWRYVTFQFIHSTGNLFHIGLNMLGLYMLGSPLEQHWGAKRFLRFYLSCGAVAGLAYVATGALLNLPRDFPIVGASGGVYGILLACAILFPQFRLILVLFLVPIRLAAAIIFGAMILVVLMSAGSGVYRPEFWSQVAHLGGAVTAAVWIWILPKLRGTTARARTKLNRGAWQRKMRRQADKQAEIDRILKKIHDQGINNLTRKEKKFLREATDRQRQVEKDLYRL